MEHAERVTAATVHVGNMKNAQEFSLLGVCDFMRSSLGLNILA